MTGAAGREAGTAAARARGAARGRASINIAKKLAMPTRGTPRRGVRVEGELWEAAKATAEDRGDNLSEVIRKALIEYNKPLEDK